MQLRSPERGLPAAHSNRNRASKYKHEAQVFMLRFLRWATLLPPGLSRSGATTGSYPHASLLFHPSPPAPNRLGDLGLAENSLLIAQ
ncbi:hypothetical protein FF011L_14420 [Roseimaritima multifibrata]|uniref:Uncharacterized protein n=1 Tax=Roseimaritima multifibrata TaxID=1930274 RepID=A0A517MCR8_9BACT|nr:hypothetical protein FF011L_14420 [Roseimaritima multifibrata]